MFEMNQILEMKLVQWKDSFIWQDLISTQPQYNLM